MYIATCFGRTTIIRLKNHHTILKLRRRIKTHIIRYHTRNKMQTPHIKYGCLGLRSVDKPVECDLFHLKDVLRLI
jgi:hypothetical protein